MYWRIALAQNILFFHHEEIIVWAGIAAILEAG